jgi:hypothetical protein
MSALTDAIEAAVAAYQGNERITIPNILEDIPAFRFVAHNGSLCAAGGLAAGVSPPEGLQKDYPGSLIDGVTALVEAAEAFNVGTKVMSDADGKAVTLTSNNFCNGVALFAGVTNVNVVVDLESFFYKTS